MIDKDVSKGLAACPSCGSKQSYLTRRCGTCGLQYTAAQMLSIAGGILEAGTSLRSIRRQISEAGRGIGREILEAASQLYRENVESTSIVALIAARDFGDPRIIPEKLLQSRYPYASQALRVEIAQTLLAAQTDEAEELIRKFKDLETDPLVKKAFDEPLISSEGLSRDLESNLMGGKKWDAREAYAEIGLEARPQPALDAGEKKTGEHEAMKGEEGGSGPQQWAHKDELATEQPAKGAPEAAKTAPEAAKSAPAVQEKAASVQAGRKGADSEAPSAVEALDVVEDKPAPEPAQPVEAVKAKDSLPPEPPAEMENAVEIEAGEDERAEEGTDDDKVVFETGSAMPPPLPVTPPELEPPSPPPVKSASVTSQIPPPAAKAEKKTERKDYSVMIFAALGIVLLGAIIAYGVIKLGNGDAAKEDAARKDAAVLLAEKKQTKQQEEIKPSEKSGTEVSAPQKEEAKQPVSHILAAKVLASSSHPKYPPENVIDGDPATVWQEDKERKPIGEWLKFEFDKEVTISRVGIVSGFDYINKNGKDFYPLNCRLKEAELIFSSGDTIKVNLNDTRSIQYISIDPPRKTLNLRITIYEVYKGSWFYDSAIGEIEVWGYEENGDQGSDS